MVKISKKTLDRFSYSRLNTFIQCPMKFKLKYIDGNVEPADAIHLDIGNITHKVLEMKYNYILSQQKVDYDYLNNVLNNGVRDNESDKDRSAFIIGVNKIREKYGDLFEEVNEKSGLNYADKFHIFDEYLMEDELGDGWKVFSTEKRFEFIYDDRIILTGFIDRIDINQQGELRVVDYKSSNKPFSDKDLTTPLQMVIYALACEEMYGKIPVEFQYDLILLGEKQNACTKGYYKRGIKKINKVLDEIDWYKAVDEWTPKPSPLCYWCEYSENNPEALWATNSLCPYYCLWTPEHKTFAKNKEYK